MDIDDVALLIPCGFCGAVSGEWCRTKSGAVALWLHGDRRRPIENVRHAGWEAGRAAGRNHGASVLHRHLFDPVEKTAGEAISRSWLLAAFYRARKELIP